MNTDALKQATDTAFTALLDATQSEVGREAYLYGLPHAVNVWGLTIAGGPDEQAFACANIGSLRMLGVIEGRWDTLEKAQVAAMQLVSATPVIASGKVIMFRITAPPSLKLEGFTPFRATEAVPVYTVSLPVELVLDCSDG